MKEKIPLVIVVAVQKNSLKIHGHLRIWLYARMASLRFSG
jgi:hypothetical protein